MAGAEISGILGLSRPAVVGSVEVAFRLASGDEQAGLLSAVSAETLSGAAPWRVFRWRDGQKHYSGAYWSATEDGHVIYESRLELARLLFADFDRSVRRIVAQPFLLRAEVDGKVRRRIPDCLLITASGPVVVDVKPAARLAVPKVVFAFGWTEQVVKARGWRYEVWSEPDPVELENVRFLAGYRRRWLFDSVVVDALRSSVADGMSVGEVTGSASRFPAATVRAALLHLLWRREFTVDMSVRLGSASMLRVA